MEILKQKVITPTVIDREFIIKWRFQDSKKEQLIRAGRFHLLVGQKECDKLFSKAMHGGKDQYIFRVRKRFVVTFKSK